MKNAATILLIGMMLSVANITSAKTDVYVVDKNGNKPQPKLAIKEVCAWPNLTQLKDGTIIASIFNKPAHGGVPDASIDCYATTDGGETWTKRGVVAAAEPPSFRQNVAVGLNARGELVAISTGYIHHKYDRPTVPAWISHSKDGGRTWSVNSETGINAIPYGDIEIADNGDLLVAPYVGDYERDKSKYGNPEDEEYFYDDYFKVLVYRSSDGGLTWDAKNRVEFGPGFGSGNETDILHLGRGEWIAVSRYEEGPWAALLKLYRSTDDGRSWKLQGHVTGSGEHPGDLSLLDNGYIMLAYGDRTGGIHGMCGVEVKFSKDGGRTWSQPRRISDFNGVDGGYPSSEQLSDGQILTAYYASSSPLYSGYHMGTVVWDPEKTLQDIFGKKTKQAALAEEPIDVSNRKQIFIDGRFVEKAKGVSLTVNKPKPTGEILMVQDQPWESLVLSCYHSVIQKGDRIHMWYECIGIDKFYGMAYAYSDDEGATWIKPLNLGQVEYKGNTNNNLVLAGPHGATVFYDQSQNDYKMFVGRWVGTEHSGVGNRGYRSADGIKWELVSDSMMDMSGYEFFLDSQNIMFWDTRLGKYVAYPRIWYPTFADNRCVGQTVSDSFGKFPRPYVMLEPDKDDPNNMDFYTSAAIEYTQAQDAYFMFPATLYSDIETRSFGPCAIQFACSRDGEKWLRPDRSLIITSGFTRDRKPRDDWQQGQLYAGYGLTVDSNNEISLYYTSYGRHHGRYYEDKTLGGILTRAKYRLDGFTSMDAGSDGGEFTTPSLTFSGSNLVLNVKAHRSGSVRVELQNSNGKAIPGFAAKDCDAITGDSVAHNVTWKESGDLSSLRSSPAKIRFVIKDAKLYSFAFRPDDVDKGAMNSSKTDWFHKAKLGIMVHYLADPLAASGGGKGKDFVLEPKDWNKQIDSFDVKALADQLEEIGVGYCLITIGQNSGHYCSPNATYDRIVGIAPSKCSRRDLVADLAGELEPRDIKLMVYLPSGAPAADPVAAEKLKWRWGHIGGWPGGGKLTGERLVEFQQNWEAVIREWSLRWGKHLAGWWIDGCYFADEMYRFDAPPNFASFASALKAGNPDAIIAFNPGVRSPIAAHTEHEDYTAGEISGEIPVCSGRWIEHKGRKIQYHVLSYMGKSWGIGDKPRYTTEKLIEYTRRVTDGGGVMTWDVRFEKSGLVAPGFVEPLKALGKAIKKRKSD